MATGKKSKPRIGGPFVAAALLCQSVSEDGDGVFSAKRIVDEVQVVVPPNAPEDFPSKSQPVEVSLWALIMIRRGDAPAGEHEFELAIETPTGETKEAVKQKITMPEFPNGAATVKTRVTMSLYNPGVFWIDVILDGKRLTRMSLNLKIQRMGMPRTEAK